MIPTAGNGVKLIDRVNGSATRLPPWGLAALGTREGAEKGINFYALENRLFEELFKFLQACSNFRFSRGYYQKKTGHIALIFRFYCPVFGLFSQDLTQILLRHFAS